MKKIDQILTNFTAWEDATNYLGVVDVELPNFEALSETIKGAGIYGESTAPVIGHFGSQTTKLNWRTLSADAMKLAEPKVHALDFRGNQQLFDPLKGYVQQEVVVKTRCVPLNFTPGKFAVAAATETANEFEVHYIKIMIDGKTTIEFDKFNGVYRVNGKDMMDEVRKNLGLS
ncbi:phage major tail tube protein [Lysinibacillus pakistanensis]|uniref:Phage major tail tube protein n=1 Tax=Lysinibacillus pakistanensis TaxID=759811 RepID=A0AAX3X2H4_9BACI|nr:phage major tail tube protein [Lysinibacillus pakistanensis]MDM5233378.1 phage major tail tube protein [Lysinibacillus pakistanensis]WHY48852.1 phage major tail tube protein [Lysinibacillus pakistanensis]WHY53864.1 phage major tail tube protein [Lysinibacillus pakistanensis]